MGYQQDGGWAILAHKWISYMADYFEVYYFYFLIFSLSLLSTPSTLLPEKTTKWKGSWRWKDL